jgi:pimeloyl-ACP methyl ester carboxylesterase
MNMKHFGAAVAVGGLAATAIWARRYSRDVERCHPPVGRFIDIGSGRQLHYVDSGEGRPVVLIHGASTQLQDMTASLMPRLAADHRVVAFDRPGHGYSDRIPYHAWAEAQAHAIHEAVRRLGLERPVIVGHSMGGGVAISYGMLFPDELSGVVFLSGLAYPVFQTSFLKFAPPAIPVLGSLLSHTLYQPLQRLMVPSMLKRFFAPQEIPERLLRELPMEMLYRPQAIKVNSEDQMMVLPSLIHLQAHYPDYPLPVAVVAGAADQTLDPRKHAVPLSEQLPDARLHLLPGMGHMVHHFAQDLIADCVEDLFSRARKPVASAGVVKPEANPAGQPAP